MLGALGSAVLGLVFGQLSDRKGLGRRARFLAILF